MIAAGSGDSDIVRLLLDHLTDVVNIQEKNGR